METVRSSKHRVAIKGGIVATLCAIVWPIAAQSRHNHVRSPEPRLQKLILRAAARSASFDDLLQRLDVADVAVYLVCSAVDARPPAPRLSFLSRVATWRYLVVHLRCPMPDDQQIVMLAHELRHAVEIADDGDVVDQRSMLGHYMRIGVEVSSGARIRAFETAPAQTTAEFVRRELATPRRADQVAESNRNQPPRIGTAGTRTQRWSEP
jgi:hypothetical protein